MANTDDYDDDYDDEHETVSDDELYLLIRKLGYVPIITDLSYWYDVWCEVSETHGPSIDDGLRWYRTYRENLDVVEVVALVDDVEIIVTIVADIHGQIMAWANDPEAEVLVRARIELWRLIRGRDTPTPN